MHRTLATALLVASSATTFAQDAVDPAASLAERNKAVVRAYLDAVVNQGRVDAVPRYFAPDVMFNGSRDARQHLARSQAMRAAFPDYRLTIEDQLAEGDKVVTRVIFRGTHRGEFSGIAATGRQVEYAGIAIDRVVDGKVVEMWHLSHTAALLQQIGASPQPAASK